VGNITRINYDIYQSKSEIEIKFFFSRLFATGFSFWWNKDFQSAHGFQF